MDRHVRSPKIFLAIFFFLACAATVFAAQKGTYEYSVKTGDCLSGIVQKLSGRTDWRAVAEANSIANPDRIYPGEMIRIVPFRPESALRQYLEAIYAGKLETAYRLVSSDSRTRLSYAAFEAALNSATVFDLESIRLCSDFYLHGRHVAQLAVDLKEDPAGWGFNLVWEDSGWKVLLYDAYPAFPHYDGIIGWRCNSGGE